MCLSIAIPATTSAGSCTCPAGGSAATQPALLVLLLLLPGVRVEVVGAVLLALVLLVMGQCGVVLGALAVRCFAAAAELSRHGKQGANSGSS